MLRVLLLLTVIVCLACASARLPEPDPAAWLRDIAGAVNKRSPSRHPKGLARPTARRNPPRGNSTDPHGRLSF
ncbi:MAG: hypothetical protein GVY16_09915 [Planctomycetes bacterium]|jgi:hypothetical protein|nr:hypothetical protein [Planctomycetota bacterium]